MAKKFKLQIELGNAAMQDGEHVASCLRRAADTIKHFDEYGLKVGLEVALFDDNGNQVGTWRVLK